jgi:predicted secreted hydrolase
MRGLLGLGATGLRSGSAWAQTPKTAAQRSNDDAVYIAIDKATGVIPKPNTKSVRRGQPLQFPRDHGVHLQASVEWWYATGWIGTPSAPTHGFQVTFFRSLTGLAQAVDSRFAARHLLFAHAAVTSLPTQSHVHDQRMVRWSGAPAAALGAAQLQAGDVRIGHWRLFEERRDEGGAWRTQVQARDFQLDLRLARSQPLLLQGDGGFSRKGPEEAQASHYVSEPQLQVQGRLQTNVPDNAANSAANSATNSTASSKPNSGPSGKSNRVDLNVTSGQAWMDHEWSDHMLHPQAVGWDWIGMNLFDGSALTAFVLRRADGSTLWAGGSFRSGNSNGNIKDNGMPQAFAPDAVGFVPGRRWRSAGSGANYPVQWTLQSPAGAFEVRALLDAQELNGQQSTGSVYWEGLSELLDTQGRRVGLGYLEMTGYAAPIKFL